MTKPILEQVADDAVRDAAANWQFNMADAYRGEGFDAGYAAAGVKTAFWGGVMVGIVLTALAWWLA